MKDFAISDDPAVQKQLDRLGALSLPQGRIGLDVIRTLLSRLGDPQKRLPPVFHVAGTNGKGSTCAFLRAMLEADGKTVHVATKPHLVRYNERIRIAGVLISDRLLADLLEEVLDTAEGLSPSFFEVTTAATFLAFARTPADACVIEVGLGGRFDATNVMERPAACGIASLGVDHEAFLLNEDPSAPSPDRPLVRIAFEKAGIARPGSPLVTQGYTPDVEAEIERRAGLAGAPLHMRGSHWWADAGPASIAYRDRHGELTLPLPQMHGRHQADNAALAVAMLRHQDFVPVSPAAMAEGIRTTRWPARLQYLSAGPLTELAQGRAVLLDGGHNPDAAEAIAAHLATLEGPVHALVGMMAAKDARRFLAILGPHLASVTAVPIAGNDHVAVDALADIARNAGVQPVATAPDLQTAMETLPSGDGTVLITGSLYLAGKVLSANREYPD
ncbi:bifunctional folylpolyglutamate synthase/dihydrofolate synthase [Aurantiacibacter gangjinensis]|uniref:Dihydrofolate synthase/folylpolyglutamate synthase n=1 Tax=Aurantiacibacter gangjinensis TaxID=502682 RepID=A0A0G9MQ13_9SPHN|nr:folylpolyglutamate synthase/dihydrofolate synthase family protein [Aurantiacibacter gangjinensis]APE28441.1 Dihydrofolate synthase, Folylpolyglutamate synthase [Aurantiacibacter gangjinensis]KLE32654.1 folylpolyglutamate synthase [Aurantiacibacter gangjinensis]